MFCFRRLIVLDCFFCVSFFLHFNGTPAQMHQAIMLTNGKRATVQVAVMRLPPKCQPVQLICVCDVCSDIRLCIAALMHGCSGSMGIIVGICIRSARHLSIHATLQLRRLNRGYLTNTFFFIVRISC